LAGLSEGVQEDRRCDGGGVSRDWSGCRRPRGMSGERKRDGRAMGAEAGARDRATGKACRIEGGRRVVSGPARHRARGCCRLRCERATDDRRVGRDRSKGGEGSIEGWRGIDRRVARDRSKGGEGSIDAPPDLGDGMGTFRRIGRDGSPEARGRVADGAGCVEDGRPVGRGKRGRPFMEGWRGLARGSARSRLKG